MPTFDAGQFLNGLFTGCYTGLDGYLWHGNTVGNVLTSLLIIAIVCALLVPAKRK